MTAKAKTVRDVLAYIQANLKAPKNQMNTYGGYRYRSCEDILEAVKPLLGSATLTISDDVQAVADRIYVKATATLEFGGDSVVATAFAREPLARKGMDESQITGAASSYARKYALNGLFCIDDTKDADATNAHDRDGNAQPQTANLAAKRAALVAKLKEAFGNDGTQIAEWLKANGLHPVRSANAEQLDEIEKKLAA